MANETLNIPDKIKVGYQNRGGTYTGKLAYVVYINKKGVLAKEKSWEGWRSKDIDPQDFDNVPTEGFVLNKKAGGVENSWGWNARKSYSRVYDPRGFEFEISIDNLLFILQECDCTKGKGLEGEFVYAWSGKDLILLPVSSEDYKLSRKLLDKTEKITKRSLVVGALYKGKDAEDLLYIGKHKWFNLNKHIQGGDYRKPIDSIKTLNVEELPVFYDVNEDSFYAINQVNRLYYCKNTTYATPEQLADYIDLYKSTFCGGADKIKSFIVKNINKDSESYSFSYNYYIDGNKLYRLNYDHLPEYDSYSSPNKIQGRWGDYDVQEKNKIEQERWDKLREENQVFYNNGCISFKNNELTLTQPYYSSKSEIILNLNHPLYKEYKDSENADYEDDFKYKFNLPCAILENGEICVIPCFEYRNDYYIKVIEVEK